MKLVLSASFLLMCITASPQPNSWRGITPVRSTCEDVKKILKVDKCSLPKSDYAISDYLVEISFANDDCDSSPHAWRVPKGTVLSLSISPQHAMTVSQFGIDLSGFKKREGEEIIGMEQYDNDKEGVSVELFQGYVLNVRLRPRESDEGLRCKSMTQGEHEQMDTTCCDPDASDPIRQAWLKFIADGRYRLVTQHDMRWREPKARASAYTVSSLGFDRHESDYYHFAAIVIDTQRNDLNRFGLVIFSAPRAGKGSYKPYWVLRDRDLSTSYLSEYVGFVELVSENGGSQSRCRIQWERKKSRYVCRA